MVEKVIKFLYVKEKSHNTDECLYLIRFLTLTGSKINFYSVVIEDAELEILV